MGAQDLIVYAVAEAARQATHADAARVLTNGGAGLEAVAVAGSDIPRLTADGDAVDYVVASGQPLSVAAPDLGGRPTLCVPCMVEGEPIGALELVGRPGQTAFALEATEIASLFAGVAGAALLTADSTAAPAPSPHALAAELVRLHASDPTRYASVARAVSALLA